METNNPYTPPSVDPLIPQISLDISPLASRGERFVGAFIDGIVNFFLMLLIFLGFRLLNMVKSFAEMGTLEIAMQLVMSVSVFAMFVGINWSFISKSGQTIGKKVAKTRMVTMAGALPQPTDVVFKRYAFMHFIALVPVVGSVVSIVDILFIFRKDKRCLHDLIAGTQVVKADVPVPVAPELI